ncbi:hypothetical protein GZ78_10530 [Endozoicomonas numazuensis]|uniref:Uncharacterized protein n=1 Tax=Endozoicomonas numazuensis TaxID=1137799 RepID=A0A081NHU8_9GAMM|nr:hypothetical protein GZ78_10530 [Endozoicomonas numazuensis]
MFTGFPKKATRAKQKPQCNPLKPKGNIPITIRFVNSAFMTFAYLLIQINFSTDHLTSFSF